jgi:hypothetical protein
MLVFLTIFPIKEEVRRFRDRVKITKKSEARESEHPCFAERLFWCGMDRKAGL